MRDLKSFPLPSDVGVKACFFNVTKSQILPYNSLSGLYQGHILFTTRIHIDVSDKCLFGAALEPINLLVGDCIIFSVDGRLVHSIVDSIEPSRFLLVMESVDLETIRQKGEEQRLLVEVETGRRTIVSGKGKAPLVYAVDQTPIRHSFEGDQKIRVYTESIVTESLDQCAITPSCAIFEYDIGNNHKIFVSTCVSNTIYDLENDFVTPVVLRDENYMQQDHTPKELFQHSETPYVVLQTPSAKKLKVPITPAEVTAIGVSQPTLSLWSHGHAKNLQAMKLLVPLGIRRASLFMKRVDMPTGYRVGDIINVDQTDWVIDLMKETIRRFPHTLAAEVSLARQTLTPVDDTETKRYTIVREILGKRASPPNVPDILWHLRIGDVIEEWGSTFYTVDNLLVNRLNQRIEMHPPFGPPWAYYVNTQWDIIEKLRHVSTMKNVTHIHLEFGFHKRRNTFSKSLEYVDRVTRLIRSFGIDVTMSMDRHPDDVIHMAVHAPFLVTGGGGFAKLLQKVNRGTVITDIKHKRCNPERTLLENRPAIQAAITTNSMPRKVCIASSFGLAWERCSKVEHLLERKNSYISTLPTPEANIFIADKKFIQEIPANTVSHNTYIRIGGIPFRPIERFAYSLTENELSRCVLSTHLDYPWLKMPWDALMSDDYLWDNPGETLQDIFEMMTFVMVDDPNTLLSNKSIPSGCVTAWSGYRNQLDRVFGLFDAMKGLHIAKVLCCYTQEPVPPKPEIIPFVTFPTIKQRNMCAYQNFLSYNFSELWYNKQYLYAFVYKKGLVYPEHINRFIEGPHASDTFVEGRETPCLEMSDAEQLWKSKFTICLECTGFSIGDAMSFGSVPVIWNEVILPKKIPHESIDSTMFEPKSIDRMLRQHDNDSIMKRARECMSLVADFDYLLEDSIAEKPLPEGWASAVDKVNSTYYYNITTRKVTWVRPVARK